MSERSIIRTAGLTKVYGQHTAVDDIDLRVAEGDRYGFLGPNGSGKTTLVRMLLGLVYATRGEIEVMGREVPARVGEVLPHIGAMVEGPAAYPHLSGRTNLRLLDASGPRRGRDGRSRRQRVEEALERTGMSGIDQRPVRTYSLGMRQRLGLAGALLHRPRLLILDEPTNGLDPHGIREVRDLLLELNAAGTTVFLSSHLLAEIEALCDRVGVVDRGRLVLEDDLDAVRGETGRYLLRTPDPAAAAAALGSAVVEQRPDLLVVRAAQGGAPGLARHLVGRGVPLEGLEAERRSLEDVVVELTRPGSDQPGSRGGPPNGASPGAAPTTATPTTATPTNGTPHDGTPRNGTSPPGPPRGPTPPGGMPSAPPPRTPAPRTPPGSTPSGGTPRGGALRSSARPPR